MQYHGPKADLSDLILGLECGGSDPTSGFSSNTVLGLVTDEVIDAGGTAILSETVECIGAEPYSASERKNSGNRRTDLPGNS